MFIFIVFVLFLLLLLLFHLRSQTVRSKEQKNNFHSNIDFQKCREETAGSCDASVDTGAKVNMRSLTP